MGSGRPNPDATTLDLPNRRGNIEIEERKGPGKGGGREDMGPETFKQTS